MDQIKVAAYVEAAQAAQTKAAAELAAKDQVISQLQAEKKAGVEQIQRVVDALVSGGKIHDTPSHRKAAAEKLASFGTAMTLFAGMATYEPTKQASMGTPVGGPNATPDKLPKEQAGLDKLARAVGCNV